MESLPGSETQHSCGSEDKIKELNMDLMGPLRAEKQPNDRSVILRFAFAGFGPLIQQAGELR